MGRKATPEDPLERVIENRCVVEARNRGLIAKKMNGLGESAWPDRLFVGWKRRVWVEFKRRGEKPTHKQALLHAVLRSCGEEICVIDNIEEGLKLVRSIPPPHKLDWALPEIFKPRKS